MSAAVNSLARAAEPAAKARVKIAVMPVLTARDLAGGRKAALASVLDVGRAVFLTSGAVAIRGALLHAGIGSGDEVLVPAFNCPSMVTPVEEVGARAVFYGINENLGIDAQLLAARISPRTKAALVPHLFGRLQDTAALRAFCDEARIVLIEDCAHAFFGRNRGAPVGARGHYAIASPRKFLPLAEGGLLTSSARALGDLDIRATTLSRAARVSFDMVDLAVMHGRLAGAAPLVHTIKQLRRHGRAGAVQPEPTPAAASMVDARHVEAASFATRLMIGHTITQDAIRRRRQNFAALLDGVRQMRGLEPLNAYDEQSEDAVPYMLPIVLSRPEEQFARLKASAIPLWRWEYSRTGVCAVTDRYARALVQIPCHQSLSGAEVARLLQALGSAASAA